MIFTWTAITLGTLLAAGAVDCIIYWDKIKEWAINAFEKYGPSLQKAYANLYRKGNKLYKKIFGINDKGKPIVMNPPDPPQQITLEELRKAYENGEITEEQYKALLAELSTEVAKLSR